MKNIALLSALLLLASPAFAAQDDMRTAGRTIQGYTSYGDHLLFHAEDYAFSPVISNNDPQNQHPASMKGQDWDIEALGKNWTAEKTIARFYEGGIFYKTYERGKKILGLEVGPTFYKLSGLDQRRSLKLITDQEKVFDKGYTFLELKDWNTKNIIGTYAPTGLYLK